MRSSNITSERMGWGDLLDLKRADIVALHKTSFAFFLTFFVWFNMAPLVTTIVKDSGFTLQQLKLLAICNVALTVVTFLFCLLFLMEPHGAFSYEYQLSSVDRKMMEVERPLAEAVQ